MVCFFQKSCRSPGVTKSEVLGSGLQSYPHRGSRNIKDITALGTDHVFTTHDERDMGSVVGRVVILFTLISSIVRCVVSVSKIFVVYPYYFTQL